MIRCNTLILEVALLGDFFCGEMWGMGCFTRRTWRHALLGVALSGHAYASLRRTRMVGVLTPLG